MPWSTTSPMDQKLQFIVEYIQHSGSLSELCERYGVSRKTGYKWLGRYMDNGPAGLLELSRRPRGCSHAISASVVEAILAVRRRHPSWGARKLLAFLARTHPHWDYPARSTVCDLLKRNGLVPHRRRRARVGHPGPPLSEMSAPNAVWSADYKGQFKTRDGRYCYPFTLSDGFSRYLLSCKALLHPQHGATRRAFERAFREYGLPDVIRTDNGSPFASTALGRLSRLSVWWLRLGIKPELTEPASPQQNGRHERMHRTLKAETTRPPASSCLAQQRRFDAFRTEFNEERPHEALDQQTPASVYTPSARPYPNRVPKVEYPGHFEVRRVSRNGGIRWNSAWVNVSTVLAEENIGFEEIHDGQWSVYFGAVRLGLFHERLLRIEDLLGRINRKAVSPMSLD